MRYFLLMIFVGFCLLFGTIYGLQTSEDYQTKQDQLRAEQQTKTESAVASDSKKASQKDENPVSQLGEKLDIVITSFFAKLANFID